MATAKTTFTYKVTSISDAGAGRVNVNLVEVTTSTDGAPMYNNNLNLNLTTDDATSYWPGKEYDCVLSEKAAA